MENSEDLDIKYDLIEILKGLFFAYKDVNYIAVNAVLNDDGDLVSAYWYLAGFRDEPWFKKVNGHYLWVEDKNIIMADEESAVFMLHFSPFVHVINGVPLQTSSTEFISHFDLCFKLDDQGNIIKFKDESHVLKEENDNV